MYPRRHFYEQICGVLSKSPRRREIPIFTDKFLASTWDDALWIYETGRKLGLVHMAGSSVPNCFHRDPWLEHPLGTDIEDALMLSYGGLESYGYHGVRQVRVRSYTVHRTVWVLTSSQRQLITVCNKNACRVHVFTVYS